jgi:hypothetical protein
MIRNECIPCGDGEDATNGGMVFVAILFTFLLVFFTTCGTEHDKWFISLST